MQPRSTSEPVGRKSREPERTCVGCRRAVHPQELVRIAVDADGRVALDPKSARGGRGAWVHPSRKCIDAMVKRHAAERTLKVPAQRDLDAAVLVRDLCEALRAKTASLIVVASRTRTIAFGADAVANALERGRVPLIVVAKDAGGVASAIAQESVGSATHVARYSTKSELGRVFGRGEVALLALLDTRIAAELAVTIDRLAALED